MERMSPFLFGTTKYEAFLLVFLGDQGHCSSVYESLLSPDGEHALTGQDSTVHFTPLQGSGALTADPSLSVMSSHLESTQLALHPP